MSDAKKEFSVTRTLDNNQLGLTALINNHKPGETITYVHASWREQAEKLAKELRDIETMLPDEAETGAQYCAKQALKQFEQWKRGEK